MSGPGLSLHVPEPHNERLLDFILERRSALSTIELACRLPYLDCPVALTLSKDRKPLSAKGPGVDCLAIRPRPDKPGADRTSCA